MALLMRLKEAIVKKTTPNEKEKGALSLSDKSIATIAKLHELQFEAKGKSFSKKGI